MREGMVRRDDERRDDERGGDDIVPKCSLGDTPT